MTGLVSVEDQSNGSLPVVGPYICRGVLVIKGVRRTRSAMSVFHVHFADYLTQLDSFNAHPRTKGIWASLPKTIDKLGNIIICGPPGVGKYTQALGMIRKYSPTDLKYERKMQVPCGKTDFCVKISDIHFEIDMALLGCNAKSLWHAIFTQIVDVLCTRPNNRGIILCKYFSNIHSELLDCFYGYMQKDIASKVSVVFMFTTEDVSFLPSPITDRCMLVPLARPTKTTYNKIEPTTQEVTRLSNIKLLGTSGDHVQAVSYTHLTLPTNREV